jgi:hypothetical protein
MVIALLVGVVENDAGCVALPRAQAANAVPQVDPVGAPRPLNRAMVHGKRYSIPLAQGYYLRSRLHPRTLFREHKLAAGEIPFRFGEKEGHLDGKGMLSIKILVKAVVIAFSILQKQGSGTKLACIMASLHEINVLFGITNIYAHGEIPLVGDWSKPAIKRRPKPLNDIRKGIAEIFVFAASKAMSCHDDAAAKQAILGV